MAFRNSKNCFERTSSLCGQPIKVNGIEQCPFIWVIKMMLLAHEKNTSHLTLQQLRQVVKNYGPARVLRTQGVLSCGQQPLVKWDRLGMVALCNRQWVGVNEWSGILWGRNLGSKPLDTPRGHRDLRIISVSSTLPLAPISPRKGCRLVHNTWREKSSSTVLMTYIFPVVGYETTRTIWRRQPYRLSVCSNNSKNKLVCPPADW